MIIPNSYNKAIVSSTDSIWSLTTSTCFPLGISRTFSSACIDSVRLIIKKSVCDLTSAVTAEGEQTTEQPLNQRLGYYQQLPIFLRYGTIWL